VDEFLLDNTCSFLPCLCHVTSFSSYPVTFCILGKCAWLTQLFFGGWISCRGSLAMIVGGEMPRRTRLNKGGAAEGWNKSKKATHL
jgi:hypothetical protein